MKKTIYALFAILLMGTSIANVDAATNFTYDGWVAGSGYGTKTEVNSYITHLKGEATENAGMHYGAFNKQSTQKLEDGILEETHVDLDFERIKVEEYFDVSLALKNGEGTYVTEAAIRTQMVEEGKMKVTAGWAPDFEVVVTEDGVYTYQWKMYVEGTKTYVEFNFLNDGKIIKGTGKIDFDTIITDATLNPIAEEEGVVVRYLWFCNISVAEGINVYSKLPTLAVDEEIDEDVANVIVESIKKDATLKEIVETEDATVSLAVESIETVEEEVEEEFSKIVKDSVVLDFFDISIKVETENDEYLLTELKEEITFEVPLPIDLPEVAKGKVRKFFVLRQHENDIEELDATLSEDGKTISFTSDRFSTYALAYVDEELPPQTGDNVTIYAILGLVTLVGFGFAISRVKKQFN